MDEADPAADAGVGAQALLGLAAGNTLCLPSLASLPAALPQHSATTQETAALLARAPSPAPHQLNVYHHRTTDAVLEPVHPLAPAHDQSRTETLSQEVEPQAVRAKAPIPRLPSLSTSEPLSGKDAIRGVPPDSKFNSASHLPIPRLASIKEWTSPRTHSFGVPVATLPRLQHRLHMHSIPPLSSPPSQPQSELPQPHSWHTPSLPSLPAPLSSAPPPVTSEWSRPAPVPYALAQHQHEAASFYPYCAPAQYKHMQTTLPQIQPHPVSLQIPQYGGVRSTESLAMRASQSPDQHPRQEPAVKAYGTNAMSTEPLHPLVNGVPKDVTREQAEQPSSSNSLSTHVGNLAEKKSSSPSAHSSALVLDPLKTKSGRKTLFAASSSGRGIVDLMNPTDTLATVASAIEPLPVADVNIESPGEKTKAHFAKMKMARDIFGTGNEISRSREQENDCLRRKKTAERKDHPIQKKSLLSAEPRSSTLNRESQKPAPLKERANGIDNRKEDENSSSMPNDLLRTKKRNSQKEERAMKSDASLRDWSKRHESQRAHPTKSTPKRHLESKHVPASLIEENCAEENEADEAESEVTRCPCGSKADSGMMLCCDECNTWQHRVCMGYRRKSDVPRMYYCNICRPEQMRPSCVAHPTYKERQSLKDVDDQCEPILLSVKPLELRKRFSADLRAKQSGAELSISEVFFRYATLYRTQFGKDRQSVIEGLVVLTEIPRDKVLERLEIAVKKSKMSISVDSVDFSNIDRIERRNGAPSSTSVLVNGNGPSRHSHKRARQGTSPRDNLEANLDIAKCHSVSPDKDWNNGEPNRLSREERKMRDLVTLFARLEERDKKRPRVGDCSGSPRNSSVSSPRPTNLKSSKSMHSPKSPLRSSRLTPPVDQSRLENFLHSTEKRKQSSINVTSTDDPTRASQGNWAVPKRERAWKDRKENRRRENRESRSSTLHSTVEGGRKHGIFSRRKERQVLSSVGLRHRAGSKSDTRVEPKQIDPSLRFSVKVPGPSVLGSKLVPRLRRSSLENEAEDERLDALSAQDLGNSERLNKKNWLLSFKVDENDPLYPIRKRAVPSDRLESPIMERVSHRSFPISVSQGKREMPNVSMVVVSKRESLPDGGKKLERSLTGAPIEGAASNSMRATQEDQLDPVYNMAVKKRYLMRDDVLQNLDDSDVVAWVLTHQTTQKKPRSPVKPIKVCFKKRLTHRYSKEVEDLPNEAMRGEDMGSFSPTSRNEVAPTVRSLSVALRSAAIRSYRGNTSKSPPLTSVPDGVRSTAGSPVLRSVRSPPPLRSAVINREANCRPFVANGSKIDLSQAKSTSPPSSIVNYRSPPPLRSARIPALRSKPVINSSKVVLSNGHKQAGTAGQSIGGSSQNLKIDIPMKEETTASDILQNRLKGFLSRSSDSMEQVSPRAPSHIPYSHGRHSSMVPTPTASPRVTSSSKAKYTSGKSWRYDGTNVTKRLHPVAGSSSGSPPLRSRHGIKSKHDRAPARGMGNKVALGNGKSPNSSTDTTPWGRYLQQNGWGGKPSGSSTKHQYPSVMSTAGQGSKSSGSRRKPFG